MFAVIVNRFTGQTRTVEAAELPTLMSEWVVVCREPEDTAPSVTDEERRAEQLRVAHVLLRHVHGTTSKPCPGLPQQPLCIPGADQWQAGDLRAMNDYAANVLQTDRLLWEIETKTDRRRVEPTSTTVRIENGWRLRGGHIVEISMVGRPPLSALHWLQEQSLDSNFSVIVPASPKVITNVSKTVNYTCSKHLRPQDEPTSADFDDLLVKVRRVIARSPLTAQALDTVVNEFLANINKRGGA